MCVLCLVGSTKQGVIDPRDIRAHEHASHGNGGVLRLRSSEINELYGQGAGIAAEADAAKGDHVRSVVHRHGGEVAVVGQVAVQGRVLCGNLRRWLI